MRQYENMEFKVLERTVYYSHFCYNCYMSERRDPYYYGTEKDKIRPCPRCGSLNVNGVFE
jgi:hypothetical protein